VGGGGGGVCVGGCDVLLIMLIIVVCVCPRSSHTIFVLIFSTYSPSGCTFWGKKPWSRKKKILWQLGTLVGAPVGISLIAGIAVPAIIIGVPIWVGRKVCIHS